MRDYELIFIVQPELEQAAFEEVVDRVKAYIEDQGGEVAKVDPWGKRKLAYPIRKKVEGQYVRIETQMQPSAVSALERNLTLLEPVMRFLVTAVE